MCVYISWYCLGSKIKSTDAAVGRHTRWREAKMRDAIRSLNEEAGPSLATIHSLTLPIINQQNLKKKHMNTGSWIAIFFIFYSKVLYLNIMYF